jgi:hypothetical protein
LAQATERKLKLNAKGETILSKFQFQQLESMEPGAIIMGFKVSTCTTLPSRRFLGFLAPVFMAWADVNRHVIGCRAI